MTAIRCPRCRREVPELTAFCAACGAPLLLDHEEARGVLDAPLLDDDRETRGVLDAPLDLDRRGGVRGAGEGTHAPRPVAIPGPAATPTPFRAPPGLAPPRRSAPPPRGVSPPPAAPPPGPARPRNVVAAPPVPIAAHAPAAALRPAPAASPAPAAVRPAPATSPAPAAAAAPAARPAPSAAPVLAAGPAPALVAAAPDRSAAPEHDGLPEPEVDALEVHLVRAASWQRVLAWVVDGVPFAAAAGALGWSVLREAAAAGRPAAPAGLDALVELAVRERIISLSIAAAVALAIATYATLAHSLAGATLGKRLVGIRVVGPDGAPPSLARSAIRSALCLPSIALFGVGFLLALFTRTGRALHDLLARTWVVKAP